MLIPDAFRRYKQWILWKAVPLPDGRTDKIPISPTTKQPINAHDASHHTDAQAAEHAAAALGPAYGVGLVFTGRDRLFLVDIDNCLDTDTNDWNPTAKALCEWLPGAYVQVSQSGKGLHIIASGDVPLGHGCKAKAGFDVYSDNRFCAFTGNGKGSPHIDHTKAINHLIDTYIAPAAPKLADGWTTQPVAEYTPLASDEELLTRALRAHSAAGVFGARATFAQLWTADAEALSRYYVDDHGVREYDASAADMALAQHLAFWTGCNCEHIERMMLQSALARDKWHDRVEGYLRRTIVQAVARQEQVYSAGAVLQEEIPEDGLDPVIRGGGHQLMTSRQQIEHFRGCVYVRKPHRIWVPDGDLLKPDQFRAMYGGYLFAMDSENDKTVKNAWEAFTESQALHWPKVIDSCFDPLQTPGGLVDIDGVKCVNAFVPCKGKQVEGDIEFFLEHMERLLPRENDREILLSYAAALVQMQGHKFQWAPVLQGLPGNGKSLLFHCLAYAVGRRHTHWLDPKDIDSAFNAWIENHTLILCEEIRMAGDRGMMDRLKTWITNPYGSVQGKGIDQRTARNCANFIFNSNYKDGALKTHLDRRLAILYTDQQELKDLKRHGMTEQYFRDTFKRLESGGYAAVAHYLQHRPINVNVMGRAPVTSSTDEAKRVSMGAAEQFVIQAIDMAEPGFGSGLLCVATVGEYLARKRRGLSPQAISTMLGEMGYVKHPSLSDGRVRINGKQHRLYCVADSDVATWGIDRVRSEFEKSFTIA
jgi:primase-polymerase (primpol)-like protein